MPQMIPITPPTELSVTASIKNCVRMSFPRAPTAMRTPISRVRSVTLTSMMFMMPIPPTTRDTPAIAPSSTVITREIVVAPGANVMPLPKQRDDLLLGCFDLASIGDLHVDVAQRRAADDAFHRN